ncbi:MAG: hypothetical protein JNL69_06050 [Bacteroidia bacterium]|nr:hypothetical protein [Bacteroidia bacterium]
MKKIKQIAYVSLWVVLVLGLVLSLGFVNKEQDLLLGKAMNIHVNQDDELYFLDNIDIANLINERGDSVVDQPKSTINVSNIESMLNSHPAISNAEVSLSIDGVLKVDVQQRKPILRVLTNSGDSYYIDDMGKLMPLSDKYTARVLVASGEIEESYSMRYMYSMSDIQKDTLLNSKSILNDLFDVASYIQADAFWKAQIQQLYVNDEKEIEMVPLVGNQKIIFGDAIDIDLKFKKLFTFYQQGLNTTGWWDKYSAINLKFKNQIVCTKK